MFKQRPQSPEYRSEDPRVTREAKVALAVGFLTAAIEATPSREAFIMSAAPTEAVAMPVVTEHVYTQPETQETLLEKARISTERAFTESGPFQYPADIMTNEFIDAQNMLHRQEGNTIVPFVKRLEEHNPIIKRAA